MARRAKGITQGGNAIADHLFREVVDFLNNKVFKIHRVRVLRDPDNKYRFLAGLLMPMGENKDYEIFVSESDNKDTDEQGATILHEVLHIIMPHSREMYIRRLEELLWQEFSRDQKQIIKSYLPKYISKRKPD